MKYTPIITTLLFLLTYNVSFSQDPSRFENEIDRFDQIITPKNESVTVFTGSSSIRLWNTLHSDCTEGHVINTGFGGSQMSDLLYYIDQTILRFNPAKIYIYEGDNDINEGKTPTEILSTTKEVTARILEKLPNASIYYLSANPSPSRWHL